MRSSLAVASLGDLMTWVGVSGGAAVLGLVGVPGLVYNVLRCSNLLNWTVIATTTAPPDGAFSYTDNSPPRRSAFYRLKLHLKP
jgi:hypothetical protein